MFKKIKLLVALFLFIGSGFAITFNDISAAGTELTPEQETTFQQQIDSLKKTLAELQQQATRQKNNELIPEKDLTALKAGLDNLQNALFEMQSQLSDGSLAANKQTINANLNGIKSNLVAVNQALASPIVKSANKPAATKKQEQAAKQSESNSLIKQESETNKDNMQNSTTQSAGQNVLQASTLATMASKIKNEKSLAYAGAIILIIIVLGAYLKRKEIPTIALMMKNGVNAAISLLIRKFANEKNDTKNQKSSAIIQTTNKNIA